MRGRTAVKSLRHAFEGFHPWLWVLAFIALVFLSIAWLDITRPPPIRPPRFSLSELIERVEKALDSPESEPSPFFTSNYASTLPDGVTRQIGECERVSHIDVDGDGRRERVCVRVATYETKDGQPRNALIVDLHKRGEWLLRQELASGPLRAERVIHLRDLDMDGSAELVTQLASNPERTGDEVGRIYKFDGYAFVETLNIFGLSPQDASAAFFLRHLKEIREEISERYSVETGIEQLCTDDWDEGDCFAGAPWLLDSNGDGRLELVQLLEPPAGTEGPKPEPYRLFVKEFRGRSTDGRSRFHPVEAGPGASGAAQLFIHRADDGRVLLLASFAGSGAPAAARSTSAFEIAGTSLKKATRLRRLSGARVVDADPHRPQRGAAGNEVREVSYILQVDRPPVGAAFQPRRGVTRMKRGVCW